MRRTVLVIVTGLLWAGALPAAGLVTSIIFVLALMIWMDRNGA